MQTVKMDKQLIYFMIGLIIVTFIASTLMFDNGCGDGICLMQEVDSCPADCSPQVVKMEIVCGDGVCDLPEAVEKTCVEDCN